MYLENSSGIVNEYIRFSNTFDKNRKTYKNLAKALEITLKECEKQDILKEYLKRKGTEMMDILERMFDQERATELYALNIAKEAALEKSKSVARNMINKGLDTDLISEITNLPIEEIKKLM